MGFSRTVLRRVTLVAVVTACLGAGSVIGRAAPVEQGSVPVTGGGLRVDIVHALDFEAAGVTVTGVKGAKTTDEGVTLPVTAGSKLTWKGKSVGGIVLLTGGFEFTKADKTFTATKFIVDLTDGTVTGTVGSRRSVRIGKIDRSEGVELDKEAGKTTATLIHPGAITLDPGFVAAIDSALGTGFAAQADSGIEVDSSLEIDVDLAHDSGLVALFGLDDDLGDRAVRDLDIDVSVHLL